MISLVIPTLNESNAIPLLYKRLVRVSEELKESGQILELIFVDDGSKDSTPQIVREMALKEGVLVRLVERKEKGLATAVLAGFSKAKGEILGVIDSDGSHPPELIPRLLQELTKADLVIASRHLPGGGVEDWPKLRQWFSRFAEKMAWPLYGSITDPMSGFFFLKRRVVDGLKLTPVGYKILLEIIVKGRYESYAEVPYLFRNRNLGKSKMNWKVILDYGIHLVKLYWWRLGSF